MHRKLVILPSIPGTQQHSVTTYSEPVNGCRGTSGMGQGEAGGRPSGRSFLPREPVSQRDQTGCRVNHTTPTTNTATSATTIKSNLERENERETGALKICNKPHHLIIVQQISNDYLMFCEVTTFSDAEEKKKQNGQTLKNALYHIYFSPSSAECLKILMLQQCKDDPDWRNRSGGAGGGVYILRLKLGLRDWRNHNTLT